MEMVNLDNKRSVEIAVAWCLAWGNGLEPQADRNVLNQIRNTDKRSEVAQKYIERAQKLDSLPFPNTLDALKATIIEHPDLWDSRIGLVYGGATKIKQYVFEASNLQDIRGASALLDRINLVDLPAFFGEENSSQAKQWLDQPENFPGLRTALIPELIIYSTGGNILAFCPAAYVHQLANAIEKWYTQETLTANSCAVGDDFRFLELRFGLLKEPIEKTNWLEWYRKQASKDLVKAYYGNPEPDLTAQFERRKSFNELVGKLATRFNQRRSGQDWLQEDRPSRRYPPMFETHPYVRRDNTDKRSAVRQVESLPNAPWFSETTARKRLVGQRAKREDQSNHWFRQAGFTWETGQVDSWVQNYEDFLNL